MKRFLCLFLCALLLLSGCGNAREQADTTAFYYCRANYAYGDVHGVIAPEQREISRNTSDLRNMLALYLVGPLDTELTSPFVGLKLISTEVQNDHLVIVLADPGKTLTDIRFSLGSACMTMTCLELMPLRQVTITCAERTATMNGNNLLLYDNIISTEITSEESP